MSWEACQEMFLSLALRSTVIVVLTVTLLAFCKNRSAPFRCALITAAMLALAWLPFAWWLPRVEVPALVPWPSQTGRLSASGSWMHEGRMLILLWFAGMAALALIQTAGIWQLRRWRNRSTALDSGYWRALIQDVSLALGYRGDVKLYRCPRVGSPAAAGILRPCVFLPEEATGWDAERLRVVLLHEIGHLKRRDLWTQWLSQTVCTFYWFHPLVWTLKGILHQTRELACDHTVLSSGTEPGHYARQLLELAKNVSQRPRGSHLVTNGLFLAMTPGGKRQGSLERRVRVILSFHTSPRMSSLLGLVFVIGGLSAVWATATFSPAPGNRDVEPVDGPSVRETATEIQLRLTADPFPGARENPKS